MPMPCHFLRGYYLVQASERIAAIYSTVKQDIVDLTILLSRLTFP